MAQETTTTCDNCGVVIDDLVEQGKHEQHFHTLNHPFNMVTVNTSAVKVRNGDHYYVEGNESLKKKLELCKKCGNAVVEAIKKALEDASGNEGVWKDASD